jgi:hypothetical protein
MRLVALSVLLIGSLFANQVLAEDVIPQPLTRVDCDKAGMPWDDNANVCGAASPSLKLCSRWIPQPNLLPERIASCRGSTRCLWRSVSSCRYC